MNKAIKFWLVASLVMVTGALQAQVGGGLFLGGIASQIDGDSYGGYGKIGYHLGGYAFFAFNDMFELEPEILIGQRGARAATETFVYHRRLNYIDVPVLVNCRIPANSTSTIMIQAGPYAGILFSATEGIRNFKSDVTSDYRPLELGAIAGITMELQEKIGVSFRSGLSLTNISNFRFPFTRNRYLELGIRYSWR